MKANFPIINDKTKLLPFYVTGIGLKDNQNPMYRKEGYPDFQIALCSGGQGVFSAGGKHYNIGAGMGFFFCPDIPHEYFAMEEPWTIKWIVFRGSQVQPLLSLLEINSYEKFNIQDPKKINALFDKIDFIIEHALEDSAVKCSALLYTLITEMSSCINLKNLEEASANRSRLEPVLTFMETNFNSNLTLRDMAEIIDVSPHFLCRLFKQHYHTSPFKYLMKLRIQKAKQLFFQSPNSLVKEVAQSVGFNDVSYFCSLFREYEGVTPSEFRSMHGIL